MAIGPESSPNWILRGFFVVSLTVHFFLLFHVSGIYQNIAVEYIELSLHQFYTPVTRSIPKPKTRQKQKNISNIKAIKTKKMAIPEFKVDTVSTHKMDQTYESVSMLDVPDTIDTKGLSVAGIQAQSFVPDMAPRQEHVEYTNAEEYFEMLNMRIHNAKKYPESAKSRHLEGRVKVEFTLQPDGTLINIRIVKSSRHRNLDDAAVESIKNASPFPRPPAFIFKPPLTLSVNILFELT